jgi:hypothetical protein
MSADDIWIHKLTFNTAVVDPEFRHSKVESANLYDNKYLTRLELCTLLSTLKLERCFLRHIKGDDFSRATKE